MRTEKDVNLKPREVASADEQDIDASLRLDGQEYSGKGPPCADGGPSDWDRVALMEEFQALLRAKRRFIVPATIFFVVYYFALPILVGYAPQLMSKQILGVVNIAYLFALSQFFMAWIIAALYVRAASRWDRMARSIIDRANRSTGGE